MRTRTLGGKARKETHGGKTLGKWGFQEQEQRNRSEGFCDSVSVRERLCRFEASKRKQQVLQYIFQTIEPNSKDIESCTWTGICRSVQAMKTEAEIFTAATRSEAMTSPLPCNIRSLPVLHWNHSRRGESGPFFTQLQNEDR